jgi:hypothetical protein
MIVPNVPLAGDSSVWVVGFPVVLSTLVGVTLAKIERARQRPAGGALETLPERPASRQAAAA